MDIVVVVITGLAGWRIANLLLFEDGPFSVFELIRKRAGVKEGRIQGFMPGLFTCMFCMSVWTTTLMFGLWYVIPEIVMLVAAWTVAMIANGFVNKEDH